MEPLYIEPLSIDSEDESVQSGGYESQEDVPKESKESKEINTLILNAIEEVRSEIFDFKKHLFQTIVSNDKTHSSSNTGALMTFHAVWLQSIAYWIGLLDDKPVPRPIFSTNELNEAMDSVLEAIQVIDEYKTDGRTLLYALLTKISTENYPFDLGPSQTENENLDSN
jgi:hypothetical protein